MDLSYQELKQLLSRSYAGDMAMEIAKQHKAGTRHVSIMEAVQLNRVIKEGKAADRKLIEIGYLDKDGHYINSPNPVFRSAAKWYEKNFLL